MDLYGELARLVPAELGRMIFVTGGAFTQSAQAFLDQVPNRCLEKPFDADRLRAVVRSMVG